MNEALWALGRGTGVVALVVFTLSIVLGIISRSGRTVAGLGRWVAHLFHAPHHRRKILGNKA